MVGLVCVLNMPHFIKEYKKKSARKRRVWESQYYSAILSAKAEITPQIQGQVASSPLQKSQSGHPKTLLTGLKKIPGSQGYFLRLQCCLWALNADLILLVWDLHFSWVHGILQGHLFFLKRPEWPAVFLRRMVSLDFVIIQLTGSDESKNDSKSSIFSKLILGATLEKYSYLVKSFILLLD